MNVPKQDLIVRCLKCGQKNRISREHLGDRPFCGRCGASLDEIYIQCLRCGRINRIPEGQVHDLPRCGKCGAPLYTDYVLDLSEENFEREVLERDETILVCCWTPDSDLCRRAMPALTKLAPKYLGNLKLYRLNVIENYELAARYSVEETPAYLLFKKGILIETIVGIASLADLEKNLRAISRR
ncbi:MAG: hypothetical protein AVO39_01700 [delta proteobacterium MLS_D]|jgi:thioredoxin 2|nr:MAG: hypothetical protein AVO39_01700 [delta proteobacterium MLS_D]